MCCPVLFLHQRFPSPINKSGGTSCGSVQDSVCPLRINNTAGEETRAILAVKMKFISPSKHAIIGKAEIKPYKWALLQILSPSLWSNL